MPFRHAAATDVGRLRDHNEDAVLVDEELGLFIVADGMGGRAAGEVASRMTVDTIRETVAAHRDVVKDYARGTATGHELSQVMAAAVHAASREVLHAAHDSPEKRGMGTTVTTILIAGHRAFAAHVGDSRLYITRDGVCHRLTRDHSLLDELVLAGHMTREEADSAEMQRLRNVLARAVGVQADILVDTFDFEVLPGDRLMLCSDGLTHYFDDEEVGIVSVREPEEAAARFVATANERGGHDNITTVVVAISGSEQTDPRCARFRERCKALASVPIFRGLDARIAFHLALLAETVDVPAGQILLREDQPSQSLYVVLEGKLRLSRKEGPPEDVSAGASFGEAALVDRWVRTPTVTAAEASRIVRVGRDALVSLGRREPEIHEQILAAFARAVATRLRAATAPSAPG